MCGVCVCVCVCVCGFVCVWCVCVGLCVCCVCLCVCVCVCVCSQHSDCETASLHVMCSMTHYTDCIKTLSILYTPYSFTEHTKCNVTYTLKKSALFRATIFVKFAK